MARSRTKTDTPPLTESALVQIIASAGNKLSADVKRIIGNFNPRAVDTRIRLLMRLDPDIGFGLALLRAPILNLQWTIESKDPLIRAFVESVMRPCYRSLAMGGSNAITFGVQAVEKVWSAENRVVEVEPQGDTSEPEQILRPNAWIYKRFKAIDPRTYQILIDEEEDDWAGIEQTVFTTGGRRKVKGSTVTVGRDRLFLWPYRSEDVFGDPRGFSQLDHAYEPWWFGAATELFANRYFERKADPPVKARARRSIRRGGKDEDGFKYMQSQILAIKSGGAFVLPDDRDSKTNQYVFDAEYMTDDKRGDMFQMRLDRLSIRKLRALLIVDDAAVSPDGGGSLAKAQQRAELLGDTLDCLLCEWLELVNAQIIDDLVRFNFGAEAVKSSGTRMVAAGISKGQRDLLKEVFSGIVQTEAIMETGKRAKLIERVDGIEIMKGLGLPMKSAAEVTKMVEERIANRLVEGGSRDDLDDDDIDIDSFIERAAAEEILEGATAS